MPDNVRRLHGDATPPTPPTVKLPPGRPNPPTWLAKEAAAEWRRVVPELDRLGVLAKADRGALADYCTAWAFAVDAAAELAEAGLTRQGRSDNPVAKNPAWQVWRDAVTVATALRKELLLTPNARMRAVLPEAPSANEGEGVLD